ncbi:GNAT family N-acetyltransferase [Nocardioides cynanchi]|uniref:GNAT family N-acetyltransferase n=1 Tax=Nocardioides cynanchi TaxID=2558918 RepID=UPI001EE263E9|nr:GNAT family N-acetyltransferase [Nocardioides cynanchi]
MDELTLPAEVLADGLTSRPLTMTDARAVYEVMAAQEQADLGKVEIEEADIVGDWQRPSFDVEESTVGVFDGPTLVAYAEVSASGRGDAGVHPSYRRRGIGTALAAWMPVRTARLGGTIIGSPVPEGSTADRLLESLGWFVRWTSWALALPEGTDIPERPLPEGYAIRTADPEEYPAVLDVVEDAFLEWSVRERSTYDDFLAVTVRRPGFEPWHFRVVTDAAGVIVGCALVQMFEGPPLEAFISRLAVRSDQRHQGLAQALLVDSFARGREHGATRAALSTDSRTGALGLYEKVGMQVVGTWVHRAVDV